MNKYNHFPRIVAIPVMVMILFMWGCDTRPAATARANELIFFDWPDDIPRETLDYFEEQTGIHVKLVTYDSMEEAVERIKDGLEFDVAVIEGDVIPGLVDAGLLAELDKTQIPNFRNIDPAFRDLVYDPDNRYTAPFSWGTTGLLVRTDLVSDPVTHWTDLWNPQYAGKVVFREQPTEMISVSLKSLGYPLNSEDPQQLQEALQHLQELDTIPGFIVTESNLAVLTFLSSPAVLMVAWQEDALLAMEYNQDVAYVLPEEGCLLWGDTYVISSKSSNRDLAHVFINFMLGDEIGADIVNKKYYSTTNAAAMAFIDPQIRENPIIFPLREDIANCEWYMPLSPEGETLYNEIWQQFLETQELNRPE